MSLHCLGLAINVKLKKSRMCGKNATRFPVPLPASSSTLVLYKRRGTAIFFAGSVRSCFVIENVKKLGRPVTFTDASRGTGVYLKHIICKMVITLVHPNRGNVH